MPRSQGYKVLGRERESDPDALRLLEEHDREHEAAGEMRVNIRWGREQVRLIKRVAAILDVPYQLYIKQVVMRQVIVDLQDAERLLGQR